MIKNLKEISRNEIRLFGGKATSLGFLIQNGFDVPNGFCISTKIKKLNAIIRKEIIKRYNKLKSKVSVRSSATVEDSKNASFAGQFDTILNVNSEKVLFDAISKCLKSLHSNRVNIYIKNKTIKNLKMAIIVQKMINADFAGVIFTIDPIKKKDMLIEIIEGLGDKIVSGEITPNSYFVDRNKLKIVNKKELFTFNDKLVEKLSKIALRVEKTFKSPQDIEFCIKDKIFILQSRPITTL